MVGLFGLLILLRLRLRGLLVDDGLAGDTTCLTELSDRRMRWYVFLIESNSTELRRLVRVDFFTGAETQKNQLVRVFLRLHRIRTISNELTVVVE